MQKKCLILILAGVLVGLGACHKKAPSPMITAAPLPAPSKVEPPPVPTPETWPDLPLPPVVVPPPKPLTASANYLAAEACFEKGDYEGAAHSYELYLDEKGMTRDRDRAMFYLGMSYALSCTSPFRDCNAARTEFQKLIEEYPESPYRNSAELILNLQSDVDRLRADARAKEEKIKRLTSELERLKKIDMERRPSRPPE